MESRPPEARVDPARRSRSPNCASSPATSAFGYRSIEATEVTRELDRRDGRRIPTKFARTCTFRVQSGSDAVLRRMRRRWGSKRIRRSLPARSRLARSPGSDDRHHRRLPRRDRGRFRGHLPPRARSRLLENPPIPLQPPPRHPRRRNAEPSSVRTSKPPASKPSPSSKSRPAIATTHPSAACRFACSSNPLSKAAPALCSAQPAVTPRSNCPATSRCANNLPVSPPAPCWAIA